MPQFDKITFFNQIFWLLLAFSTFYFLILKSLLPVLAASLKTRKKLVASVVSGTSLSSDGSVRKSYSKNLQKFIKSYKTLFSSFSQKKLSSSEASKTKILGSSLFSY